MTEGSSKESHLTSCRILARPNAAIAASLLFIAMEGAALAFPALSPPAPPRPPLLLTPLPFALTEVGEGAREEGVAEGEGGEGEGYKGLGEAAWEEGGDDCGGEGREASSASMTASSQGAGGMRRMRPSELRQPASSRGLHRWLSCEAENDECDGDDDEAAGPGDGCSCS